MAEQKFYPQRLAWGRLSGGQFIINIEMQVPTPNGAMMGIPVSSFILTKEEEGLLKAFLSGIHLPASNGHSLKL